MSLRDRAMNVSLSMSAWRAERLDRKVTGEVLEHHKAAKDAGKFVKLLVPEAELQPLAKAQGEARRDFYRLTLPWQDNGIRILTTPAFLDFTSVMSGHRSTCERLARHFCEVVYPQLLPQMRLRMNGLYDERDYPAPHLIHEKFGFTLDITPIADAADFRVGLSEEVEDNIRKNIVEQVNAKAAAAQRDLWQRLLDVVKHFAVTMADNEKTFRNTTVSKLVDLATLAPKLSLTPDPVLDAICADVRSLATTLDPDQLRESKSVRATAASKASATVKRIEDAMAGAF